MTTPQCIHIPAGSVAISGELFDHFCDLERVLAEWQRMFRECEAEHDTRSRALETIREAVEHRDIYSDQAYVFRDIHDIAVKALGNKETGPTVNPQL